MTSTAVEHRPVAPRPAAPLGVLVRVLVALVVGAAVVLTLSVLRAEPSRSAPGSVPSPAVVQPVTAGPAAGPVDGLVADPAPRPDVRWSEQDGTLVRDCSQVHGCGPWYDTSYGADGPPMDSITEYPPLGGLDAPSTT